MNARQRAIQRVVNTFKADRVADLFNAPKMRQFLFNVFTYNKYNPDKLKEVLLRKISHLYYLANQGDKESNDEGKRLEQLVEDLESSFRAYITSYQNVLSAANKELTPDQKQILKEYFRGLRE